jgi:hypothetical protein
MSIKIIKLLAKIIVIMEEHNSGDYELIWLIQAYIDRLKCIIADNTIIQQLDSIDYSNHNQTIIILSNLYQKLASSLLNSSEDFNNISNKINHTEFCKDSQRTIIRQMEVEDIETELTFEQI